MEVITKEVMHDILSCLKESKFFKTKQPAVISFHCNCRNAALIANQACKELPGYLDDLNVKNWYFLKSISIVSELCGVHITQTFEAWQTRFLSLEICVNRLFEQYDTLLLTSVDHQLI